MLKFENSARIEAIHIGNECSAFVEVFVGKLGADVKDFKVRRGSTHAMEGVKLGHPSGLDVDRYRIFGWQSLRTLCLLKTCQNHMAKCYILANTATYPEALKAA